MAIKIIKPGRPGEIKRFTCSRCGCVFEADRDDYEKRRDDFRMEIYVLPLALPAVISSADRAMSKENNDV